MPQHEHQWNTIRAEQPDFLMLLGDNVYSDAPKMPEMQHYCYYRRQSRPEFRELVARTPTYTIWDDHDFGTNDCSGGPELFVPAWKLPVYRVFVTTGSIRIMEAEKTNLAATMISIWAMSISSCWMDVIIGI